MPDKEADKIFLNDNVCLILKTNNNGDIDFLALLINAVSNRATSVPPRKEWKNP
jgi:hypothetical protein